jgi:hypothetical protein
MITMAFNTNRLAIVADIQDWSAFRLANEADVTTPDSDTSEGARFLRSVRDATLETLTGMGLFEMDSFDAHQIADDAPSIYTYTRWLQFTDLAAWTEDISELSDGSTDMEAMAGVALYIIAERLVGVIVEAVMEAEQEDTDAESNWEAEREMDDSDHESDSVAS